MLNDVLCYVLAGSKLAINFKFIKIGTTLCKYVCVKL